MVEGAAYGNNDNRRNCARNLDHWTRSLAIEESLVLCISDRGSSRGSVDTEVEAMLGFMARGGFCRYSKRKYLVGSVKPTS